MIRNYLTIAIRNLLNRKVYSLMNVVGLTLGMACCLFIFHYVSYEQSFDSFESGKNIFRLKMDNYQNGALKESWATTFPAVGPTLKKEYTSVTDYCRMYHANVTLFNQETDAQFHETKGYYADAAFIDFFNIKLINGNNKNALNGPDKIIMSERMAKKYFGNEIKLGKKLSVRNVPLNPLEVTGVFKDYPENSHLKVDYIISFETFSKWYKTWREGFDTESGFEIIDFYTYLKLKDGIESKAFEKNLETFSAKYLEPDRYWKNYIEFHLLPIRDIHLYAKSNQEAEVNGNGTRVNFLKIIAIIIICIAWINYINLTTARSVERAKEVGVRKVLGAHRENLIIQFICENFILNLISVGFALLAFIILVPQFDLFTGRSQYTGELLSLKYWVYFTAIFIFGTLISAFYPAFVISGFAPVKVLKGAFKNTDKGIFLRRSLIITQFTITVILLAGTIIVYKQLQFMRKVDLGININQTLVLHGATSLEREKYKSTFAAFKNELLNQPFVKNMTASNHVLAQEIFEGSGMTRLDHAGFDIPYMSILRGDQDFADAYKLKIIAGRNFTKNSSIDNHAIIINQSAVKALSFYTITEALGKRVKYDKDTLTIIGVMANYHQEGLQKPIIPIALALSPFVRQYYSIKLLSADIPNSIESIHTIWDKYFKSEPFDFFFLNDSFNAQYNSDILFGKVFGLFASLAIFIACFGLFGLSSYNVSQRSKEIGIRKVLGASVNKLVVLLSVNFVVLVLIAILISFPLGWYVMHNWLQDYAYRISISWKYFALADFAALLIAILTISIEIIRSSTANPIKSLRTE